MTKKLTATFEIGQQVAVIVGDIRIVTGTITTTELRYGTQVAYKVEWKNANGEMSFMWCEAEALRAVAQPSVMDKSAAVVLEETPFCDPEAWRDMVIQSMWDDQVVWRYERETRNRPMPVRFEAVAKSEEYSQWINMETTYFEITGNNYGPLVEIDFYHYLANRR